MRWMWRMESGLGLGNGVCYVRVILLMLMIVVSMEMAFRTFTSQVIWSVIPMRLVWNIFFLNSFGTFFGFGLTVHRFWLKQGLFTLRFRHTALFSPCSISIVPPWQDRNYKRIARQKKCPRRKDKACYFGSDRGIWAFSSRATTSFSTVNGNNKVFSYGTHTQQRGRKGMPSHQEENSCGIEWLL
jgi:hypothetical protein